MNTQAATQPIPTTESRTRVRALTTSLLVAVVTALGLLVAGPASAYTTTSRSGVPVTPIIYKVQGAHYNAGSPVTGPMWKPWIYQSGPVLYRVAGSGTQSVRVTYRVDRWNGTAWVQRHSAAGSVSIGAAVTSAKGPNLSILPSDGSGHYRVRIAMTWTSPIGAVLGSMNVTMSQAGDYVCSTSRTCSVGAGWVYLGN